ncbi:MAG: class I SAM-dependent rRNA methyltransferase, partial [Akkermansia sp.]|nr:class I SAM-dependent rRNA methyltransferase [Akkermansia sp.]
GVNYLMDMGAGYSQGIFLDQRDNRAELRRLCRPGMKVLNTFAYTGAFSVCAALSGAQTTTLDLAQPCLSWCRENMALNDIDPDDHYFCKGDALHWMDRFARQGRRFDIIVLDPPTFSRDEKGHVWRVEKDYDHLVNLAAACLAPHGRILCSTNCRKLTMPAFRRMVSAGIPGAQLVSVPMTFDFDGEDYLKCIWAIT